MKKPITIVAVILFIFNFSYAQITDKEDDLKTVSSDTTDGWEKGGVFSLTLGQSSFSNWAAGGINSFSFNALGGLFANYKKNNLTWDNTLDLGYGFQRQGKDDNVSNLKTDDKLDFATKLGLKATDKIYYTALANFKTQFADGFEYPDDSTVISSFLAPGYLLTALGIDYKPNKDLSVFIAPVTSKTTFVNNQELADIAAFGVDSTKNIRNEFGGYIKTAYSKEIFKNVSFNTKLDFFLNYLNEPEFNEIDVNWEVLLAMKVNKFITANISTQLIYDTDVSKTRQLKEILGIGFSFKF